MSYMQNMNPIQQDVNMISEFRGYNHNPVIGGGEFYEQENISSDAYPLLTCRRKRMLVSQIGSNATCLSAADELAWIQGDKFYYDGQERFTIPNTYAEYRIVRMGAYLCIFPSGVVYNTTDGSWESIEVTNTSSKPANGTKNLMLRPVYPTVNAQGEREWITFDGTFIQSDTEPDNPSDGDYWIRTSVNPVGWYRYSAAQQMWVSIATVYLAIYASGITNGLHEGDGVAISGLEDDETYKLAYLNGSYTIEGIVEYGNPGFVIAAPYPPTIYSAHSIAADLSVSRSMPEMNFVCEMGNRLYGCGYSNNEIYASKLGDPLNWNVFQGVSTDSYAATVGSAGPFSGCVGYCDTVLFFKEDCIHILSGTRPSTYQIDTLECNGVQLASDRSLCITNEVLIYKGVDGFYAYMGGLPQLISDSLSYEQNHNCVALASGTNGTKYYVELVSTEANEIWLLAYDTRRGFWNCEEKMSNMQYVDSFASIRTKLYFLRSGEIWCTEHFKNEGTIEGEVQWSATSGLIGLDSPFGKYVGRIRIRAQVGVGSVFRVLVDYDESGHFQEVARINSGNLRSVLVPISPERCDTMRIRLEGRGEFKLFSISYMTEQGGEV